MDEIVKTIKARMQTPGAENARLEGELVVQMIGDPFAGKCHFSGYRVGGSG
jgi:hypothetical protein